MAIRRFKSRATAGRVLKSGTLAQLIDLADIRKTVGRGDGGIGTLVGIVDGDGTLYTSGLFSLLAGGYFASGAIGVDGSYGSYGTVSSAGVYHATGVIYGAGDYATEASRNNMTASATEILTGYSVTLLGSTTNGSATAEAHTADQVLKSAGGNYNDDNLAVGNVIQDVDFGLGLTGTGTNLLATHTTYLSLEAGRNTDPGVANVLDSVTYKILNVSLVGEYVGTAAPDTPTLTFADSADGTGGVATVADSTAGATNDIYTMPLTGGDWTLSGTRSGDGTVALSLAVGGYAAYILSSKDGGYSVSPSITLTVTDATDAAGRVQQICDALVDLLATADVAGAFARTLGTKRAYTRDINLTVPVGTLNVLAVPTFTQRRRTSNGTYRRDVVVEILVRTHLDADATVDQATTDAGMYLIEQIDDYLADPDHQTLTLPDGELAIYVEPTDMRAGSDIRADAGAMWLEDHLMHLRQVTGLVRVAYYVDLAY